MLQRMQTGEDHVPYLVDLLEIQAILEQSVHSDLLWLLLTLLTMLKRHSNFLADNIARHAQTLILYI